MTERALGNYRAALATCPSSGAGVHAWMMGAANLARFAEVPALVAVEEITRAMTRPPSPPSEVRDAVAKAYREQGAQIRGLRAVTYQRKPKIRPAPLLAADYIRKGKGVEGMDFLEASPVSLLYGDEWWLDAVTLFRALFLPQEHIFCGETQQTPGVLGRTVRTREEWEAEFEKRGRRGAPLPLLFLPNPVSPSPAKTKDGKDSLRCDASVVTFRHAVAEMDEMPLAKQFEFWWGRGLEDVAAVTFSGHHSLHVLIRVDAPDLATWDAEVRNVFFERALVPMGCDRQCENPGRLSRLAGAWRVPAREDKWKGKPAADIPPPAVQKLWYVREELTP